MLLFFLVLNPAFEQFALAFLRCCVVHTQLLQQLRARHRLQLSVPGAEAPGVARSHLQHRLWEKTHAWVATASRNSSKG
jgi:hypothetical protein